MKPRAFAALAVITVVALALAIASYTAQNRWSQAKVSGAALLPGLAHEASRIARVELQQGDKALVLAKGEEGWTLADRGGYPAKPGAVRALLVKLAQAELVEGKTRSKDRFALLELEDPGGKDSKSRSLRLLDDKGGLIAETIVGKKRWDAFGGSKSGTYVRKPADTQTWLSNADLEVSLNVRDWVQPAVFDLAPAKIAKLTVEIPGEEPLVIVREAADPAKHTLVGLPEGKKLKESAGIDAIVRAVGNIELDDVRKAPAAAAAGEVSLARIEADGGLTVAIKLRKEGEDTWVSLEASGAEAEAKKSAEDIGKRTQGWEYKVPSYKAQSILKRRADLIEAS
jgi:hypothetical protein